MQITRAYSGVVAGSQDWKKVEVVVNEEDLASLLHEAGIEIPREQLKTAHVFALLTSEVELLMFKSMLLSFNISKELIQGDIDKMKAQQEMVLGLIKESVNG